MLRTKLTLITLFVMFCGSTAIAQTDLLFGKRGKGTTVFQEYLFVADTLGGIVVTGSDSLTTDYVLPDSLIPTAVLGLYGMSLNPISNEMYVVYGINTEGDNRRLGILNTTDATITDIAEVGRISDITFMDNVLYATTGNNHPDEYSLVTLDLLTGDYTFIKDHLTPDNSNALVFDYYSQRFLKTTQFTPRLDEIAPIGYLEENLLPSWSPGWTTGLAMADSTTMVHVGNTRINTMDLTTYTSTVDSTFGADEWWHSVAFTEYPLSLWVDGIRDGCSNLDRTMTIVSAPDGAVIEWYLDDALIIGETAATYSTDDEGVYYAIVDGDRTNDVEIAIGEGTNLTGYEGESDVTINLCDGDGLVLEAFSDLTETPSTWDLIDNGVEFFPAVGTTVYNTTSGVDACNVKVTVFVDEFPTITAVVDDSTICIGDSIVFSGLRDNVGTYEWSDIAIIDSVAYTPATAGDLMYVITAVSPIAGCITVDSVEVTVNALPEIAITTVTEVCAGNEITLTAEGATTYVWSDGLVTDEVILMDTEGMFTYSTVGTDDNGCENSDTIEVTVFALPVVTAAVTLDTVCDGSTIVFTGSGAETYEWDNDVVDGEEFTVTGVGATIYTVTGTDANGCENAEGILVTVTENTVDLSGIITSIETFGSDGAIDITIAGGAPAYTFDWDNDGTGDFDDTEDLAGLEAGVYTVVVKDSEGCEKSESYDLISQVGIEAVEKEAILAYPNPTTDVVTIELEGTFTYTVLSTTGEVLATGNALNKVTISLEDVANGTYFIQTTNNGITSTIEVVKQ